MRICLLLFELAYLFDRISLCCVEGVELNLQILISSPGSSTFNNSLCFSGLLIVLCIIQICRSLARSVCCTDTKICPWSK